MMNKAHPLHPPIHDEEDDKIDEFFGSQSSDDEDEYDGVIRRHGRHEGEKTSSLAQYEAQSQSQSFHKLGYHEAYDKYKDHNLQLGFEEGFINHMNDSVRIGKTLAKCVFTKQRSLYEEDNLEETDNHHVQAASMVRTFLEAEQVKDGSNSDKVNKEFQKLEQNLEDILSRIRM